MATSNFYQDGNHGLNVIIIPDDEDNTVVEDTLQNIVDHLNEIGYSVDDARYLSQAPRSFETGQAFTVHRKDGRMVAMYELCAGYYSGTNVNIYTGNDLTELLDDDTEVTKNKRDVTRVVNAIKQYTEGFRKVATFSNGESIYERD